VVDPREVFRSVGDVWLVWLAGCALLAAMTVRAVRRAPGRGLPRLLFDEEGAAYSLSYVMVFPIYMLLVCLVVETSLVLMVKTGTVYAAYSAARSQVVWSSAHPDRMQERRRAAAVQAIAPFAAAGRAYAQGAGVPGVPSAAALLYARAYRDVIKGRAPSSYLVAKYLFAERATRVESVTAAEGDVAVRVTYEMPLHVPGAGRIIGQHASWPGARFYTRRITSTAVLPAERPVGPAHTLGIDYVSD
jgi:hypothetical protein